jgi:hypothetical protein
MADGNTGAARSGLHISDVGQIERLGRHRRQADGQAEQGCNNGLCVAVHGVISLLETKLKGAACADPKTVE